MPQVRVNEMNEMNEMEGKDSLVGNGLRLHT